MSHHYRDEVVGHFIKLVDPFYVSSYYGLLLFKHPNVPIYLGIAELLILKVSQSCGHLVLALVIEEDVESTRVVIDLKLGPHGLINLS